MDVITQAGIAQIYTLHGALRPADYESSFRDFLDVSEKSRETYLRNLHKFSDYMTENGIEAPTRADILRFKDYLKAKGLKNTTIKAYLQAVKLFFSWLDAEGIYRNPAKHIKSDRISKEHKRHYITSSQARELLDAIDTDTIEGKRNNAICSLMLTCALRCIEVHRANIEDLKTLGDSTALFVQGKGCNDRGAYVTVPPQTERAIREYLETRQETNIKAPLFVTCSKNWNGERISTRTLSKICKESLKAIGLNRADLTAHSFRHTGVTLSLIHGQELRDVSKYARHADISTTEIYDHEIDMHKNTCSEAVAAAIYG